MELQKIERLAVFKMRNIGDVLLITPLLRALRETFPGARITVVVNSGTEDVLKNNPHVDELLVYPRRARGEPLSQTLTREWRFVRQLAGRRFDLTIGLTEGDRTAWYTRLCHARYRMGIRRHKWSRWDPRYRAYNLPTVDKPGQVHEVEKQFKYVLSAGIPLRQTEPGDLCLEITEEERAWAREQLAPFRPGKVLHVHPISRWLWKCWRNDWMAETLDWLQEKHGVGVVVTTGPVERERDRTREILQLCRTRTLFFDGTISLRQTAALSAESDGFFGVDTGPMHMAAAVGVPVLALFGPTFPRNWRPWTPKAHILSSECPCHDTGRVVCPANEVQNCMKAITPEQVQAELTILLGLKS